MIKYSITALLSFVAIGILFLFLALSSSKSKVESIEKRGIYNFNNTEQEKVEKKIRKIEEFNLIIDNPEILMYKNKISTMRSAVTVNPKIKRKGLKLDFSRTLEINGVIGTSTLRIANLIKSLDSTSHQTIFILINSPGGSVLDGARIVSAIQNAKSPVYTICTRLCASMAFIIHQYGSKRLMLDRSVLMSHFASTSYSGDVERIKSYIDMIQKYVNRFSREIANRAGMSLEDYINLTSKDLWMLEEESKAKGFSDGTVNIEL